MVVVAGWLAGMDAHNLMQDGEPTLKAQKERIDPVGGQVTDSINAAARLVFIKTKKKLSMQRCPRQIGQST